MQLPRGTFREIKRAMAIESLLRDLEGEKFSGIANISSQSLTGTLVFKAGKCILIKFLTSRGDAAWDELQKARSEEVDAALALLDDIQMGMALDFNKQFKIQMQGTHAPVRSPVRTPARSVPLEPISSKNSPKPPVPISLPKKAVKSPHTPQPPVASPPGRQPPYPKPVIPIPPSPPNPVGGHDAGVKHDTGETSSFEADLDTLDSMDFETVTDKIRTDCKTMIKQLHLEHLTER